MPIDTAHLHSSLTSVRGMVNTLTLAVSFVLSIMVINNYRQCQPSKGYDPNNSGFVKFSYILSILVLVVCCLMFSFDLFHLGKRFFHK